MSDKLKGLPSIYYLNMDRATERRDWMEGQFDHWGIKNFKRFSGSNITPNNFDDWSHFLFKPEIYKKRSYRKMAISISTLEMVKHWLETTNEKYLILMEDDYDLNLIKYWHFDWEYFMNRIPYDWDCIQLGFESNSYLSFFLHPKPSSSYYGPVLINRWFAEKLLRVNTVDGKYFFIRKYGREPYSLNYRCLSIDEFFVNCGRSYQIPLITQKPFPDEWQKYHHLVCRDYYYWWWMTRRDLYSLDDFFTYGKPNDFEMTVRIPPEPPKDVTQ